MVLAIGYILSGICGFFLPMTASKGIVFLTLAKTMMVFGSSWVQGVFWSIPSEIYSKDIVVAGTGFCSGASNLANPLAPLVVGVAFGMRGMWTAGWLSCAIISILSLITAIQLAIFNKKRETEI